MEKLDALAAKTWPEWEWGGVPPPATPDWLSAAQKKLDRVSAPPERLEAAAASVQTTGQTARELLAAVEHAAKAHAPVPAPAAGADVAAALSRMQLQLDVLTAQVTPSTACCTAARPPPSAPPTATADAAAPPPSARVAAQAAAPTAASAGAAPRRATSAGSARYVGVEAARRRAIEARDARDAQLAKPGVVSPAGRLARAEAAVGRLGRAQHDNLGALRALAQENAELRKTSERQRRALKRMQAVEDDAAAARAALRRTEAARAETGKQLDDAKHALAQCRAENQRLRTAVAAGKPGTWGV